METDTREMAGTTGRSAAEIMAAAADEDCSDLIMDLVAHPKGLVSHKEFRILNPSLSGSKISRRLSKLQEAGVVEKVDAPYPAPGEPRAYYYLTEDAREVFDRNQLFEPGPLEEMFDRIDHSTEFEELLEKERPDVDAETVDVE
jgi:DNA-binding HxlR family transcriptional regulator